TSSVDSRIPRTRKQLPFHRRRVSGRRVGYRRFRLARHRDGLRLDSVAWAIRRSMPGLARYRYVLMDVQRFCSKRTTPDEWAALIGELSGYGLEVAPESIDLGSEGCYRLFESRSVAERMSMRGNRIDAPRDATVQADAREIAARARAPETPRAIPAADVAIAMLPPRPRRARRKRLGGLTGISALL